jgi:hypothetical protein
MQMKSSGASLFKIGGGNSIMIRCGLGSVLILNSSPWINHRAKTIQYDILTVKSVRHESVWIFNSSCSYPKARDPAGSNSIPQCCHLVKNGNEGIGNKDDEWTDNSARTTTKEYYEKQADYHDPYFLTCASDSPILFKYGRVLLCIRDPSLAVERRFRLDEALQRLVDALAKGFSIFLCFRTVGTPKTKRRTCRESHTNFIGKRMSEFGERRVRKERDYSPTDFRPKSCATYRVSKPQGSDTFSATVLPASTPS